VFLRKFRSSGVKAAVPDACQKGWGSERRGKQESKYCDGLHSRIDAEGQTEASNYLDGSGNQHDRRHQAAGAPYSMSSFAAMVWLMMPRPFIRNMIDMRTEKRLEHIAEENSLQTPLIYR
jgi:hypothetical protein